MGTIDTPPAAPNDEVVLWRIHKDAENADLSFVKDKGIDRERELAHLKRLNATQRREIAGQVDRWVALKDKDPAKAEEQAETQRLLDELRKELTPPTVVKEFVDARTGEVKVAMDKIYDKVEGDAKGLFDGNVPWQDKVITVGKYIAGAIGLTWLLGKINEGIDYISGGQGWWSGIWKFLGGGAVIVGGAHLIANAGERTTGPALVAPAPASAAPTAKPKAAVVAPKAKPTPTPTTGPNLFGTDIDAGGAKIALTVDGADMVFTVDGTKYVLAPGNALLSSPGGGMYEGANHYVFAGGHQIAKTELAKIAKELKAGDTSVNVTLETFDEKDGYKPNTKDLSFVKSK